MNSRHFYFNPERNNFEQQTKRKMSGSSADAGISAISGTTTPKHFLNKLSSSSSTSSSMASCKFSMFNGHEANSAYQLPMNPFEETNRFLLEQSVLSPNLFHVANTSTPEVNTSDNCLFKRFYYIIVSRGTPTLCGTLTNELSFIQQTFKLMSLH